MENAIELSHVSKAFGRFQAVDDLSLHVPRGSMFGLLGPNGAGKTTTIRMIMAITAPDSGSIQILGRPMDRKTQNQIGYLPEERGLYRKMKVIDHLYFLAAIKEVSRDTARKRIDGWLEKMELRPWLNKKVDELSKGMQQKTLFVSTILHDPDLVILDEPFSGLDPINSKLLTEIVQEMKNRHKTIIFSTHLMAQAEELCESICLINQGQKLLEGKVREIKRSFGERTVALDGEGFDDLLDDHAVISSVERFPDRVEVVPVPGIDSQVLLERLVAAGARLRRFELVEPSLNDIFIESVNRMNATLPERVASVRR